MGSAEVDKHTPPSVSHFLILFIICLEYRRVILCFHVWKWVENPDLSLAGGCSALAEKS